MIISCIIVIICDVLQRMYIMYANSVMTSNCTIPITIQCNRSACMTLGTSICVFDGY